MCYQLQQKRRLINELKAELEYCRKKWALARAINNESEEQCRQLRKEFSLRKIQDQNNSGESGYSDEHEDDIDEDNGKISKTARFDRNLLMFDRTASPTFTERRQSESSILHDHLYIFSRAQSEPPQSSPTTTTTTQKNFENDLEVLDLITDPLPCEEAATQSRHDDDIFQEVLVVQSPPVVHNYDKKNPPKIKTNLRKNKKKKKCHDGSQKETAEEMFTRLMCVMNGENSTASTTTIDEDELELDNVEEIPLDPVPEVPETTKIEQDPMEPSTSTAILTSTEKEYLQRREERLARLEAEAKEFYEKMTRDKEKRLELSNKLTNVHQNFLDRHKETTATSITEDDNGENVDEQKTNENDNSSDDGKS